MIRKNNNRYFRLLLLTGTLIMLANGSTIVAQNHTQPGPESIYLMLPQNPTPFSWPILSLAPVVAGFVQPTSITHAGDDSGRLFVTEKPGRVRIVQNGLLLAESFLDISTRIGDNPGGEQGLLSVAFPPGYGSDKFHFYVFYTDPFGTLVIARFRTTTDPDIADPNSEEVILPIAHPTFGNHNGGQLQFGPDGYLYISTGDGGGGGDPFENAENPNSLLGKLLRIDVESAGSVAPYTVPPTNPYINTPGYQPEIWALGLRNPWRFSFDRVTGDIYIGDVGQGAREEVNFQPASSPGGEDYGWDNLEGSLCYEPATGCIAPPRYSPPVSEYDHTEDCSITGGYVFRGPGNRNMQGIYFYADICSAKIRGLQRLNGVWESRVLTTSADGASTFGEDQEGNLYVAEYGSGVILQMSSQ